MSSLIPQLSPNPVDKSYNQQISTNISIRFIMQDSASAAGQNEKGMALPGKHIFATYSFQSPIMNTPVTNAPQILVGGNIQILSQTVYSEKEAMTLWYTYILTPSAKATIDLTTKNVTVL